MKFLLMGLVGALLTLTHPATAPPSDAPNKIDCVCSHSASTAATGRMVQPDVSKLDVATPYMMAPPLFAERMIVALRDTSSMKLVEPVPDNDGRLGSLMDTYCATMSKIYRGGSSANGEFADERAHFEDLKRLAA